MAAMERASAIIKPGLRDRTTFLAGRRAIRTRPATIKEKAEASIPATIDAVAVLIRLCRETIKVVVAEYPLSGDVAEAATTISMPYGRPHPEALAAATYFSMMSADDLADLAHRMMAARSGCPLCRCGGGYTPIVASLAQAAAQATLKPWAASGLNEHFAKIKLETPTPVETSAPHIKAVVAAINQVVVAAGFPGPLAQGAEQ